MSIPSQIEKSNSLEHTPYVQIETQGGLFKVKRLDCPRTGGGLRGKVNKFTPASRLRLIERVSRITDGPHGFFVTLTYHDSWPSPKAAKRELRSFIKRLERWTGQAWGIIWKLEPQKRGAPHFHLILFPKQDEDGGWAFPTHYDSEYGNIRVFDFLHDGRVAPLIFFYQVIRRMWAGTIDAHLDDLDRKRVARGDSLTNVKHLSGGRKQVMYYVSKYVAKLPESEVPEGAPVHGVESGQEGSGPSSPFVLDNGTYLSATAESVGRWWGIWHAKDLPFAAKEVVVAAIGAWFYSLRRTSAHLWPKIKRSWVRDMGRVCPGWRLFTSQPEKLLLYGLTLMPEVCPV